MKLRRILCLVLALLFIMMAGCGNKPAANVKDDPAQTPPTDPVDPVDPVDEKNYRILFVGNSSTFYNDMPTAIFKKMVQAAGHKVEVVSITKSSYTLEKYADVNDEMGAMLEKMLSGEKKYDYVVIQDLTRRPTANIKMFYEPTRYLIDRIRQAGAEPVLYATIARPDGDPQLVTDGLDQYGMTCRAAAAYQAMGDEKNVLVAHAGTAFYNVDKNTDIGVYHTDLQHPNYAGSFVIAATIYATIYNEDPTQLDYRGMLAQEKADILLEEARKVVFEPLEIPAEHTQFAQENL